ncbi:heme exporter protein CcmD [Opacimonas viscosa]|uniref:Heme exporter protein D n=1 Tax=Opacimonas viscosa TaxID=2961944 RepID=A0AA41WZT6_9ALTE|nr:heme exporter protein CcmD [Opacimonas viscosa]MCP3427741.1 heme exporter protein CcmD [Opacimonas viscosa]
MAFSSFSEFWAMGGYGFFVWLSYGISALAVVLYIVFVRVQNKKIMTDFYAQQARDARIAKAKAEEKL